MVTNPHQTALIGLSDRVNYQTRFRELAHATGCSLHDPLHAFLALDTDEREALWSPTYGHLSARGHEAMADALLPVLRSMIPDPPASRP